MTDTINVIITYDTGIFSNTYPLWLLIICYILSLALIFGLVTLAERVAEKIFRKPKEK